MRRVRINPFVRAIGVFGVVGALATGVTFAALQAQATMTDSTVTSATMSLKLWDGDSFETTAPGFTVTNFLPGTGSSDYPFYFKNDGGGDLNLWAKATNLPITVNFIGLQNAKMTITGDKCGQAVTTTIMDLINTGVALPCNPLPVGAAGSSATPNAAGNYRAKFDIDPTVVSGTTASITGFNITYTGTQVVPGE